MSLIPKPDAVRQWLTLAYGEIVAEEAMSLPWDLRVPLYGSVILYGPAGEEIFRCVETLTKALALEGPLGGPILSAVRGLEPLRIDPYFVTTAPDLTQWAKSGNSLEWYSRLCSDLNLITLRSQAGVIPLLILLNGQYLFEPGQVALDSPYLGRANNALRLLGLPSLQGALAAVSDVNELIHPQGEKDKLDLGLRFW